MSEHLLLAPLLESYFRRRLTKQRNATPATLASYRDALRMLILFAAARLRKKPAALALDDLDRDHRTLPRGHHKKIRAVRRKPTARLLDPEIGLPGAGAAHSKDFWHDRSATLRLMFGMSTSS